MNDALLAALGEENEFGTRTVVPDSFYPTTLTVNKVDVTDPKKKQVDGREVSMLGNPFIELVAAIDDGPFGGTDIRRNYFIGAASEANLKGGKIQLLNGACRAITGQPVDMGVLPSYGINLPAAPNPGESPKEFATRVRNIFAELPCRCFPSSILKLTPRIEPVIEVWDGPRAAEQVPPSSRGTNAAA